MQDTCWDRSPTAAGSSLCRLQTGTHSCHTSQPPCNVPCDACEAEAICRISTYLGYLIPSFNTEYREKADCICACMDFYHARNADHISTSLSVLSSTVYSYLDSGAFPAYINNADLRRHERGWRGRCDDHSSCLRYFDGGATKNNVPILLRCGRWSRSPFASESCHVR